MKGLKKLLILVTVGILPMVLMGQNCDMRISIASIEQGENVPYAINAKIENYLMRAVSKYGVTADPYYGQFFVTGRFDHALDDIVPGPPSRHVLKTTLTLYVGDAINRQVYATTSFELKGVGNSEERAYISALSALGSRDGQLAQFMENAKSKIIDYYNQNYTSYLSKARNALQMRRYDEALYYTTSIPECCVGYAEASRMTLQIFQSNVDYDGDMLLAKARAAWSASPDENGAREAWSYLSQIDPSASCYGAAMNLGEQIRKTVKEDRDFEYKEKYRNEVALEKQRIAAARDIGVAWAKNQPRVITNYVINNRHHFYRY